MRDHGCGGGGGGGGGEGVVNFEVHSLLDLKMDVSLSLNKEQHQLQYIDHITFLLEARCRNINFDCRLIFN